MQNLNMEIGKRLAVLRKAAHMTQEELAESLNVSVKHISCVERGTSSLSLERMIDVCDLFCVTLDYLIRGEKGRQAEKLPPALTGAFLNAKKEEQKLLLDYVKLYTKIRRYFTH